MTFKHLYLNDDEEIKEGEVRVGKIDNEEFDLISPTEAPKQKHNKYNKNLGKAGKKLAAGISTFIKSKRKK